MNVKEKINVCHRCEKPTVWTFIYRGAEIYCPSCGMSGDCFAGNNVDSTPELEAQQKDIQKRFDVARKHILSGGAKLRDCKVCFEKDQPHHLHWTEKEKKLHKQGVEMLKEMKQATSP